MFQANYNKVTISAYRFPSFILPFGLSPSPCFPLFFLCHSFPSLVPETKSKYILKFLLLYPFLLKAETFFSLLKINSADFCSSEIIILFWISTRKWFCNSYKVSFHLYLQEEECLFSCLGFLRSHRIVWLNYFRFTMSIFLILVWRVKT